MAKILSIPIGGQDIRCWGSEPARSCSSKALYSALNPATMGPHWPWKHLWKLDLPSKFLFFTWRVILNKLPTADCLQKLHQEIRPICNLCHQEEESVVTPDRDPGPRVIIINIVLMCGYNNEHMNIHLLNFPQVSAVRISHTLTKHLHWCRSV